MRGEDFIEKERGGERKERTGSYLTTAAEAASQCKGVLTCTGDGCMDSEDSKILRREGEGREGRERKERTGSYLTPAAEAASQCEGVLTCTVNCV